MVRAQLYGEEWMVGGPRQSFWQIEHVSYASFVFGGGGASLVCAVLRLFSSSILAQSALLAACCLWNVCMLAHSLLSACLLQNLVLYSQFEILTFIVTKDEPWSHSPR